MTGSAISFFDSRIAVGAAIPARASNPRQSPEFDALEAEIGRLETEGPAGIVWGDVVRLSAFLLESRGKDLLIACWLAHALHRLEQYRGLATGLGLIRGMMDAHWDGMQPPPTRERARSRALEWFADRSAPLCEQRPDEDEAEAVLYAYQMLDEIEGLAGDRQPKFRPELGHLSRALRLHVESIRAAHRERDRREAEEAAALVASLPAVEEAHGVAEAAAPAEPAPVPDASPPAPAPRNAGFDPASIGHLPETLRDWAAGLLAGNAADSLAYALSRVASWARLHRLPPHAGGRTVAMPPAAEAEAVRALISAGRKIDALQALEAMVWTAPFWFEGHRLSARILGEMGADYADAQAMVGGMVSLLLRRFPDLADFAFADGSPFVDPATRDWLAEMGSASADGPEDTLDRTQAEARSLVAAGRGQEAVKLLAGLTKGDVTGRNRFVRQILQVRLCLDMGLIATAIPLLDHMDQLLDAHALETWEPALAAEVAELRVRALTHAEAPRLIAEDRRRTSLEAARRRLAGLDLATASHLFR